MKLGKMVKRLIISLLLAVIVISQLNNLNFVSKATNINTNSGDKLYLSMSTLRDEIGYGMSNISGNTGEDSVKTILSLKSHESASATSSSVTASNLYCIKAGIGYTWETMQNPAGIVTYSSSEFKQDSVAGYYNELLWVIDHMYIPGEDNKETFLNSIGIVSEEYSGETIYYYDPEVTGYDYYDFSYGDEYLYTLTEDDIIAVQQAVIWYYTNYKVDPTNQAAYNHLGNNTSWLKYTTDGKNYSELSGLNIIDGEGPARNEFATILYNYLIDESTAQVEQAGTYKLQNRTVKLWTATTNGHEEQPIIEVHTLSKEFDLALRKTITSVASSDGTVKNIINENEQTAIRNVTVDKSTLNNEDDSTITDTATYKHRKDPVVVEQEDIVTYTLTIYNEGQQAGYATKIVDQLPGLSTSGLRLLNTNDITSSTGNVYSVGYSTITNKVTLTLKSANPQTIPAYDGTTLSEETITFECEVMTAADSAESITLTNIAYIAEEYNAETRETITTAGDRDSTTTAYPTYSEENDESQNGITYGTDVGYTGNDSNLENLTQNSTYYKGEQDDDDFEKLVILPIVPSSYKIQVEKIDNEDNTIKLSGAVFEITTGNGDKYTKTTDENGLIEVSDIVLATEGTQTISIREVTPPTGYNAILTETLQMTITTIIENRTYKITNVQMTNQNTGSSATLEGATIKVTVPNEKITGEYDIQLEKVDSSDSSIKLQGATFNITVNGETQTLTTDAQGKISIDNMVLTETGAQTITVEEVTTPEGYKKVLTGEIQIQAEVTVVDGKYKITNVTINDEEHKGYVILQDGTIKITVPNEKISGTYNIKAIKEDTKGNKLAGTIFKIEEIDELNNILTTYDNLTTSSTGIVETGNIKITEEGTYIYRITEVEAPNTYIKEKVPTIIKVTTKIENDEYVVEWQKVSGNESKIAQNENTIEITMVNKQLDLSLRKFITKIDGVEVTSRFPVVDTTGLVNGADKTAKYSHIKEPVLVEKESVVTYNLKIYNEATIDGIATIIKDQLPLGLSLDLTSLLSDGSNYYIISAEKGNKYIVTYDEATNIITFTLDTTVTTTNLQAFENLATLDSDTLEFDCIVDCVPDNENNIYLTNIAYIYEEKAEDGTVITTQTGIDRDSEPYTKPEEKASDLNTTEDIGYKGDIDNPDDLNQTNVYYKGEQDDDDFEKLVILPKMQGAYKLELLKIDSNNSDLKLQGAVFEVTINDGEKKTVTTDENGLISLDNIQLEGIETQVITINEVTAPTGYNKVLTEVLTIEAEVEINGRNYNLKNAVIKNADSNGSTIQLVDDTIKLTVPNEKITGVYNIKVVKEDAQGSKVAGAKFKIELLDENNNVLSTYNDLITTESGIVETGTIQITEEGTYIYRITEIEAPNRYIKEEIPTIIKVTTKIENEEYIVEYEKLSGNEKEIKLISNTVQVTMINKQIDLALRKSITAVKGKALETSRLPQIDVTKLEGKTSKTANYNHGKTPVLVDTGDYIEYTLRIYNEGSIGAYAGEIKDYLPEGIEYIEAINIEGKYEVQVSEDGRTLTITNIGETVIPAYEGKGEPQYDEIKIKCKITAQRQMTAITLTNIAEITKYIDENKVERVEDRDSEPENFPEDIKINRENYNGNGEEGEYVKGQQDDDDFEKVVLNKLFDLSLRKVITAVDGVSTGEGRQIKITALDKLMSMSGGISTAQYNHIKTPVVVKNRSVVTYNINIYNEAAVDGNATIIRDQLPLGLKLDFTNLQTRIVNEVTQYYIITTKGNKYIVTYDETSNIIQFTLDTENVTNLQAFINRESLDSDTLEFDCIVNCVADTTSNIYLTNIAYIYEEKTADGVIITNQEKEDRDSEPYNKPEETASDLNTIEDDIGYIGDATNPTDLSKLDTHYKGEQDDDDFEKLVILPQVFDLKLIKYIDEVNGEDIENRILNVDTSKLNSVGEDGKTITTAEYEMDKNPIGVKAGDFIKYTFRIYNEGNYDGYATEISEDIPQGLVALMIGKDALGNTIIYTWDGENLEEVTEEIKTTKMYDEIVTTNSVWGYSQGTSIIKTNVLQDEVIKAYGMEGYTNYADQENKIDYKEISVILKVKENAVPNGEEPIRNEAAITEDKAIDEKGEEVINTSGEPIEDRDSKPEEWKKEDSGKDYNDDGWEIYQEDDEDYDNIILKEFDLSLRKQIIKIENTLYPTRYAKLDNSETNTIYNYYDVYNNKAVVKEGDIVTYSIRVYNEGEIDGYADLIVDALPSGLEFIPYTEGDESINDIYGWKLVEGTTNVYETDYLSYENDTNKGTNDSTIIKAYTGTGEADFKEVEIQCKVKEGITKDESLLNVAQIAEDSDEDGKPIRDKDSEPGKTDNEENWKEEDDLDIEILKLHEFDLALRKFITEIEETGSKHMGEDGQPNKTEVTDRIPQISYDSETNKITYAHSKEPLIVHVGDTVIYTIRVYNEGEIDGYAKEITDNIPEYLEYLPSHIINQEFKWKMYNSEGKETEDVLEAEKIKTTYLSKEDDEENLIEAFDISADISDTNPDYKEVKIAFKVKKPESTETVIINFAQISDDSDAEGEPIKDKDSTPDNGEETPKEDDEDIEKVKVQYFDLALLKYVTKVIVTEDGQQTITETGNVGDENDIVPKVEINKKKIDSTEVKFAYTIKITNEGQIAGYATEITDYIPEGLEFKAEDNPNWTDEGNNIISTRQLEDVLLQPGESREVEVILKWINGENNLGSKINIAEISEDNNDEDVPDRDSTPDNQVDGEDDIDDAEVILSIKTGGVSDIYTKLTLVLTIIVLIGIVIIKKYVL